MLFAYSLEKLSFLEAVLFEFYLSFSDEFFCCVCLVIFKFKRDEALIPAYTPIHRRAMRAWMMGPEDKTKAVWLSGIVAQKGGDARVNRELL